MMKRIITILLLLLSLTLSISACKKASQSSETATGMITDVIMTTTFSTETTISSALNETTAPAMETETPAPESDVSDFIVTTESAQPATSAASSEPFLFTGNREEDFAKLAGEWHADSEAVFRLTVWPDGRFVLKNLSDTWEGTLQLDEESLAEGYLPSYFPVLSSGERIPEMGAFYTINAEDHFLFLGYAGENFPFIR